MFVGVCVWGGGGGWVCVCMVGSVCGGGWGCVCVCGWSSDPMQSSDFEVQGC